MEWDAKTYDAKHGFVTEYGNELIDLLDPKAGETVLDVGCGTGHLTASIAARGALATGLDESESMLRVARQTYPDLAFILGDISCFEPTSQFDAIFSNAALHWVLNAEAAVRCMAKALRSGGRFVIEMGGSGNIDRVMGALLDAVQSMGHRVERPRKFYPTIGEYASMLERHGIYPESAWHFARPTPLHGKHGLRDWYLQFGKVILDSVPDDCWNQAISHAEDELRHELFVDGAWYADYKRLRLVARRT